MVFQWCLLVAREMPIKSECGNDMWPGELTQLYYIGFRHSNDSIRMFGGMRNDVFYCHCAVEVNVGI